MPDYLLSEAISVLREDSRAICVQFAIMPRASEQIIIYLLGWSIIMSLGHIIAEVGEERESSEGWSRLDEEFFLGLHSNEMRYIKLKYGRKSKETEKELGKLIMELVGSYTECIDYFGGQGDAAAAYFQIKIKEVNRYFQFLNTQLMQTPEAKPGMASTDIRKDLGSISEQTGAELLPEEDREVSVVGKEALNHNVMVYLQSQDIKSHINESKKKEEKIFTAIAENLKKQEDTLSKRKRLRKAASRNRVFLSFSERNLDHSRSSENSELVFADMEALEANSPEELKTLALRLDAEGGREDLMDSIGEKILQILQDD